jgi:transcriptional regulator with XRE-family HTH domain
MAERKRLRREQTDTSFSKGLPVTEEFKQAWRKSLARREVGRRLERMRRAAGLTQSQLAERMGKDQAYVARMESGRGDMPKAENIALFASRCGFATAYAFVELESGGPVLHELQPIDQSDEVAAQLETVHDVSLYSAPASRR